MPAMAAPTVGASQVRLAGDILWLAVTVFSSAVIVGIVCWPLSTELSSHPVAGAAASIPNSGVIPEPSARATLVKPSSLSDGGSDIPVPGPALTTASEVGEGSSSIVSTTSAAALIMHPITDRPPNRPAITQAELIPPPHGTQPALSAKASMGVRRTDPRQLRHPHQQTRPAAPVAGGELVPW